jgi:hypothetical protein
VVSNAQEVLRQLAFKSVPNQRKIEELGYEVPSANLY